MKKTTRAITFLTMSAAFVGCTKKDAEPAPMPAEVAAPAAEQPMEAAPAPAPDAAAMPEYTFAQKVEFNDKMKKEVADLQVELDALSAKVNAAMDPVKTEGQAKIKAAGEKLAAAKTTLGQIETSTEATWEAVRNSVKQANTELKESFNQARQWASEKIAP